MNALLLAWAIVCNYQTNFKQCEYETDVFQYVTHHTLQNSEIVPYSSYLNKVCGENPEWCPGMEAASKLGDAIRKAKKKR